MQVDYNKVKLKSGIEIHQRLNTKKLFCDCSTDFDENDKSDREYKRNLTVTSGELGIADIAAKFEDVGKRDYYYKFYKKNCCLVDLDEEPPHDINKDALNIACGIAKALNIQFYDEIQVMRKTVLDGSNTSGFQRTSMLGTDGFFDIEIKKKDKQNQTKLETKKIGIDSIYLEEESCGIIEKDSKKAIYDLRRLGIPLVEIATKPDMKTPEEIKLAAERLGLILRSFNVKRGLGTIRQDLNISINNGKRVELKGAQDLANLDKIVDVEVQRQIKLNEVAKMIKKRIDLKSFEKELRENQEEITSIFKNTKCNIIKAGIENNKNGICYAIKVPKCEGILGIEVSKNKRIGSEVSSYAKISGIKGLFHSDEDLEKYKISDEEIKKIKKELDIKKQDAFIILSEDKAIVDKAIKLIEYRLIKLFSGVLEEVRHVEQDFTSKCLRPMPGKARMYPETDIIPFKPVDVDVPELLHEKIKRYVEENNISYEQAKMIVRNNHKLFEELIKINKPTFVIDILSRVINNYDLFEKQIEENIKLMFNLINENKISKASVEKILENINTKNLTKFIEKKNLFLISGKELENKLKSEIKNLEKEINSVNKNKNKIIFGKIMNQAKLYANPQEVIQILNKILK